MTDGKLFIWIRNVKVPAQYLPCGTPDKTYAEGERLPSTTTHGSLSSRKAKSSK